MMARSSWLYCTEYWLSFKRVARHWSKVLSQIQSEGDRSSFPTRTAVLQNNGVATSVLGIFLPGHNHNMLSGSLKGFPCPTRFISQNHAISTTQLKPTQRKPPPVMFLPGKQQLLSCRDHISCFLLRQVCLKLSVGWRKMNWKNQLV